MPENSIFPDKNLQKIWVLGWWVGIVLVCIPCLVLYMTLPHPAAIVCGIGGLIYLVVMLPVLIWLPYYWKSLSYSIEEDAVRGSKGVFWKKHVTVPYRKITNVDITQGPIARHFGIATVHLQTAGAGGADGSRAELKLEGIREYENIREEIHARIKSWGKPGGSAPEEPTGKHKATTEESILTELRFFRREWVKKLNEDLHGDIYRFDKTIEAKDDGKFRIEFDIYDVRTFDTPQMNCTISADPGLYSVQGSEFQSVQKFPVENILSECNENGRRKMELLVDPDGKSISRMDITFRTEEMTFYRIYFLALTNEKPVREDAEVPAIFNVFGIDDYYTQRFIDFHPTFVHGTY